ncbi:lytic transglycosylase domain-containing protein [Arsenophonus nasoniae]|uniref:Lytic transglycosylase domain-containing protein n=1 Tax=Arsenophonus nasoniae TaxID=638 RepID=A0ABY8NX94_9GAMM|nr:lytic transglycosylase domain-containing protein [Arsenophonus nasoniae]WGM09003.1 lytic transglycosylase domain-containing protein [Arsenophonus nasoniae]
MILPYLLMCAPLIHPDTLNDIARVESSFNPYAIAVVSKPVKSFLPKSHQEAREIIQHLEDKNKNYSVGLMQINRVNFKRFRVTGEQLLDGCTNLNVAEKILIDCYHRGKNLKILFLVRSLTGKNLSTKIQKIRILNKKNKSFIP